MPKFRVFAIASATKFVGEFEAETPEEAEEMAQEDDNSYIGSLCHQCADEMEIGDVYEFTVEEVKPQHPVTS